MGADQPFQANNNRKARSSVESTVGACPEPSCDSGEADFPFGALAPNDPEPEVDALAEVGPEAPTNRPLIAPGEYNGEILKHEFHRNFGFPEKLSLVLQIRVFPNKDSVEPVIISRIFNYYDKARTGTDLYKEWVKVNGGKGPTRSDRMSLKVFWGKLVRVRVRTVVKDKDGDPIKGDLRYSVVGKILELL